MDFDLLIVGAGPVGASLALALHDAKLRIAVVEAHPPKPLAEGVWDNRVYAIGPGNAAFLEQCSQHRLWQRCDPARIGTIEDMRVFGDDGHSEIGFSAYDAGLGELAFTIESRALQQALWDALPLAPHIQVIAPAVCRELVIDEQAAHLTLADGRELRAKLVVGADGGDSWVRAQAGIAVEEKPYHQSGVVANFATEKPHHKVALQWFRRDSVLAFLPLPGNQVSMVWSTTEAHAAHLLALTPDVLATEVAAAANHRLGALRTTTVASAFPLRLQRVSRLVTPRCALIGDAAHSVHPLAGQGVNLGLRDVRELAQVLAARGAQTDCGDIYLLRRYERARREDVLATQITTDALQRLFNGGGGNAGDALAVLRNWGLRVTDHQSRLKRFLVQQAAA
jgi:ubiquinone biosynthesis UbiH/UbiF/VisC/COQ6 family hydroxylase